MLDILLVDDDELVRQSMSMLLSHEGFQVTAANGGREALQKAREQTYDLVVSDVRMPDMDGFEVVRQLRELQPDANFVLITGYASEDAPVEALRLRIDDYFRKPFDLNFFLERIRQFRRQRRQRSGLTPEQSLEKFTAWLRRRPGFAERHDPLEEQVARAAQRLGLDSAQVQSLRLAVRLQDLVVELPTFPAEPIDCGHGVAEQAARLLIECGCRPLGSDLALQLLLAAMHLAHPQKLPRPAGVDGRIWEELGQSQSPPEAGAPQGSVLRVYTLGHTRVAWGEAEIPASQWESHRARWLFLYLVSRRGQWVSNERLRDMFWPESDEEKAQRSLVSTIHRCRKALGEASLLQRSDRGYSLESGAQLWWDLEQLERAHRQLQSADPEPALRQIEALYQGEFCPDCPYEWADPIRQRAHRLALEGIEKLGRLLLEESPEAAEGRARRALQLESTSESAAEILLRALWAQGRRDEAVRTYRDFCQRLERELSLPPGPDLLRTYLELTQLGS
jgi:two-component SAPR family response regulator